VWFRAREYGLGFRVNTVVTSLGSMIYGLEVMV
jgi:hypothetical protein